MLAASIASPGRPGAGRSPREAPRCALSIIHFIARLHRTLYRLSRGRVGGGMMNGMQIIMLTATGRTSGRPRTAPLTTLVDGDRWIVTASNSGSPHHPQWYRNLIASPNVTLQEHRRAVAGIARTASAEERALLSPRVIATTKTYADYQRRTTREFPLVIIERAQ